MTTLVAAPFAGAKPAARPTPTVAAAAAPIAVRFEAVSKRYPQKAGQPGVTALESVSFDAPSGSITGVIGRSGAGKSTLVRLINGLETPSEGRLLISGVDIAALKGAALRAQQRRIGMIFQHFNLLSSRTAFENVALPLELAGAPKARIASRVGELLDLVGLADKRSVYPVELSGGQKQRVGIARALATNPELLLSDEATSALDPETTQSILDLLRRVNRLTGVTILLITHEMEVVKAVADRVIVLESGRLVEQGSVYELFARPKSDVARRFVASVAGSAAPDEIRERLSSEPTLAGRAVLRITFTGPNATAPILSRLSRALDIDVNILAGHVDEIGGAPFGSLVISVPAQDELVGAVFGLIRANDLQAELLGYVA